MGRSERGGEWEGIGWIGDKGGWRVGSGGGGYGGGEGLVR